MIGERIIEIANPSAFEEFAFIAVESGNYVLRFGGIEKGRPELSDNCNPINNPFTGRIIEHAYTDEENVYVFVENDGLIKHGLLNVSGDGEFSMAIFFDEGEEVKKQKKEFADWVQKSEEFIHKLTRDQFNSES